MDGNKSYHTALAEKLIKIYPEATRGFSVSQLREIWEDHAAGWIGSGSKKEVASIFDEYRRRLIY